MEWTGPIAEATAVADHEVYTSSDGRYRIVFSHIRYGSGPTGYPDVWYAIDVAKNKIIGEHRTQRAAEATCAEHAGAAFTTVDEMNLKPERCNMAKKAKSKAAKSEPRATIPIATAAKTKPTKAPATTGKPATEKRMSALDAAAKVLGEFDRPMSAPELVEQMAAKGYWSSPNGKTPAATLYAAIIREIGSKGKEARFKKGEKGMFAKV